MSIVIGLLALILAGFSVWRVSIMVGNVIKGKKWWVAILTVLAIAGGALATILIWTPLQRLLVKGFATVTAGGHPLVPVVILSIVAGIVILVVRSFLRKGIADAGLPRIAFWAVDLAAYIGWSYLTIDLSGAAPTIPALHFLVWHFVIAGLVGYVGYKILRNWYPEGQNNLAIPATYLVCLGMTGGISWMFGWNGISELTGSLMFMGFFLGFNLLIFWFSYVLGKPNEDLKKRPNFYVLWLWCFILFAVLGWIVYLQATHQMTRVELTTARTVTQVRLVLENLRRENALTGHSAAMSDADRAAAARDEAGLEKALKKLEELDQKQRKIQRTEALFPQRVEKSLNGLGKMVGICPSMGTSKNFKFKEKDRGKQKNVKFDCGMELEIVVSGGSVKILLGGGISAILPPGNHPHKVEDGKYISFVSLGKSSVQFIEQ